MNLEVQVLRWYIAVAEELHFARAAKSLNIARTRLSRAVTDLETELGYPLFVPGASPTTLTEAGSEFLPEARRIVAEDEELRRREAADRLSPTFTIGYTEGVTLTKWTRIWAERFPDIELNLVSTTAPTQLESLLDDSVDVGFVRLPIERDGLSVITLYEEVVVVVVPKDHPVAAYDRVPVTDLADEHLLQDPVTVPEWAAVATEIADGTRSTPPEVHSNAELLEYVAAGLGIAVVPQSIARLHARKDLVYRPVDGVAGSPIAIAWPTSKTTEQVEEFVGIVRGRSVRSSRGPASTPTAPARRKPARTKKPPPSKASRDPRRKPPTGNRPKRK
ncbi:LysR family transcriptional regulator [Rhodococcoides yunnanense]|uniref:LysR family transcriptional regulator n=1 Tax=Rhodococcoides yunnanense TaxID=278209 RepID=UPI000933A385|nr:LysR family transcriptional regulator [Rhodococcus yunnanensis]